MPTPDMLADERAALTSTTPVAGARLEGTEGDDTHDGTEGDDQLRGLGGNDRLSGRGGADWISGGLGDDTLDGGDGDDILLDNGGRNTIGGGRGDDIMYVGGNAASTLAWTVDGGDGSDSLNVSFYGLFQPASISATGGAGRDTYSIHWYGDPGLDVLTIHDFTAGNGGDVLDVPQLTPGAGPQNPFAPGGGLRLVQVGADTVVQLPSVNPGYTGMFGTVVLKNVVKENLSFANFAYGFDPTGSTAGKLLGGGAGDDEIFGSAANDSITGAGGADRLAGGLGDDRLDGGAGDDILDGDAFYRWRSESWNPFFSYHTGDDVLDGGDGNDKLRSSWGNDVLHGGAGNDELSLDHVASQQEAHRVRLHGDAGADHFILAAGQNSWLDVEMEGGSGSDVFTIGALLHRGALTITDFTPGQGGDVLDLFDIAAWSELTPFADGTYRVVQSGADTIVQVRTHEIPQDIVRLKNVDANALSHANFAGGHDPRGLTTGALFIGSAGNDNYTGSGLGDTIVGAGGNDTLSGGAGNDEIQGDSGDDILAGEAGNDVLAGGAGDDRLDGGAGNDILRGGQGKDRIDGGAGRDTARLEAPLSNYRITRGDTGIEVTGLGGLGGTDTYLLTGVERIAWFGSGLAFDADGSAGQVYRLYRAAFDRAPDARGMGFWMSNVDNGATLEALARAFVSAQEFQDLYAAVSSHHAIVLKLYQHVLDREPDAAGLAFWREALDSGRASVAGVLAAFSESLENQQVVAGLVANGIPYET